MPALELEVNNSKLNSIISSLDTAQKNVNKEIDRALRSSAMIMLTWINRNHWYKNWSGKLTRSFRWRKNKDGGIQTAVVYQDASIAPYGKFHIEGTGIYGPSGGLINLNKNNKFKGYYWRREGRWVGNPIVKGIKPENLIERAYEANLERIQNNFDAAVKRIAGGV